MRFRRSGQKENLFVSICWMVGVTGIEPVTPTMSRRGATGGFGVKVLPTGRKVFFLDVRVQGKYAPTDARPLRTSDA